MVETLLSTVFLAILVIASIQLVIMVVNDLIANEAAYSISRVAVVSKDNDINNKTRMAEAYLLAWITNSRFIPNGAPVKDSISAQAAHNGNPLNINTTSIKYIQRLMFGSFFTGSSFNNILKCTARARMVKSPDEDFYDKSFPQN